MDAFSYLSVLLSIIIGLGVTQLLTGVGRIIRNRDRIQVDWLPLLWAAVLLVVFVQVWWSSFGLRTYRDWTFGSFLFILAQTGTLYLMAAVLLPEQIDESPTLAGHYERQHRWFFGFLIAALVFSILKDRVISNQWPTSVNLGFHALMGAEALSAILVRHRRYQEIIGVLAVVTIAAYIGLLFTRLQ